VWNSLLDGMGSILAFFYSGIPSYGVSIIGLTVLVRLVLFPLTAKQARSQMKMTQAAPEIKKIQAMYKEDKQKQNEEVMKYYKENKINPVAGCLPLVAQMPIFFALFAVLRKPWAHVPQGSKLYDAFCGTRPQLECAKSPEGLHFLGMDLSKAASAAHDGFAAALPYFLLIALVVLTGYLQFKQTQSRQSNQANPQMAMMGKIFPIMFAFISLNLPSGVVLYFLVSNAWQIGQQAIIYGSLLPQDGAPMVGTADGPTKAAAAPPPKPKPKSEADEPPAKPRRTLLRGSAPDVGDGANGKDGKGDATGKTPGKDAASGSDRDQSPDSFGRAQPSGSRPKPRRRRR
jgi:YidC/Oxa1 family membrane protein insertase